MNGSSWKVLFEATRNVVDGKRRLRILAILILTYGTSALLGLVGIFSIPLSIFFLLLNPVRFQYFGIYLMMGVYFLIMTDRVIFNVSSNSPRYFGFGLVLILLESTDQIVGKIMGYWGELSLITIGIIFFVWVAVIAVVYRSTVSLILMSFSELSRSMRESRS